MPIRSLLKTFIIPTRFHDQIITNDTRNYLLVTAALIAAVTFQAGVNPPGGVWQDTKNCTLQAGGANPPTPTPPADDASPPTGSTEDCVEHKAGQAVYSSETVSFKSYLICNSIALGTAIQLVLFLTYEHAYFFEVLLATFAMAGTYVSAITAVTPSKEDLGLRFISFVLAAPVLIRLSIFCLKKIYRHYRPASEDDQQPNQENQNPGNKNDNRSMA